MSAHPQLIFLAAPCGPSIKSAWLRTITDWSVAHDKDWYVTPLFAEHTAGRIDVSRSKIISAQIELNAPWCITLDTDARSLVPLNVLMGILEEDRLDGHELIVGPTMKADHLNTPQEEKKLLVWTKPEWGKNIRKDRPFRITGAGLGFMALSIGGARKLKVLAELNTIGGPNQDAKVPMYCETTARMGEDNSLILNANDSGLSPVCDPRILVGHMKEYEICPASDMWEAMRQAALVELAKGERPGSV